MAKPYETALHSSSTVADLEFMAAFQKAIRDPEQRKQIICVLESAGLLPSSVRRPA